jgi:hypothetical protein
MLMDLNNLTLCRTRTSNKTVLRRGFKTEAEFTEGKRSFSDLIFVVHGVGQKKYENLVVKNTAL